jgi:hypothetical protein
VIDGKADVNLDDTYYVEKIVDHKGPASARFYLIKWLNFPASENNWEPVKNLIGCEQLLQEYWQSRKTESAKNSATLAPRKRAARPKQR